MSYNVIIPVTAKLASSSRCTLCLSITETTDNNVNKVELHFGYILTKRDLDLDFENTKKTKNFICERNNYG